MNRRRVSVALVERSFSLSRLSWFAEWLDSAEACLSTGRLSSRRSAYALSCYCWSFCRSAFSESKVSHSDSIRRVVNVARNTTPIAWHIRACTCTYTYIHIYDRAAYQRRYVRNESWKKDRATRREIHETRADLWGGYVVSRQLVRVKCQDICRYSQVGDACARARPARKPAWTRAERNFTVTPSWSWLGTKNSVRTPRREGARSLYLNHQRNYIWTEKHNIEVERCLEQRFRDPVDCGFLWVLGWPKSNCVSSFCVCKRENFIDASTILFTFCHLSDLRVLSRRKKKRISRLIWYPCRYSIGKFSKSDTVVIRRLLHRTY